MVAEKSHANNLKVCSMKKYSTLDIIFPFRIRVLRNFFCIIPHVIATILIFGSQSALGQDSNFENTNSSKFFEKANISKKNRINVCNDSISNEFSIIIGFITKYSIRTNINKPEDCLDKHYDIRIQSKNFPEIIDYAKYFGKSYFFNSSLCKITSIESNRSIRYVEALHIGADEDQVGALNCILFSFILYFDINVDRINLDYHLDKKTFIELMSKIVYIINDQK